MILYIMLLINFHTIASEIVPILPSPFFIPPDSNAIIPVPFFIHNYQEECIFLPPLSSNIWGNSLKTSYENLSKKEKLKINAAEKLCRTTSLSPFSVENSTYQFIAIAAPSLKQFLLSTLKKQGLSSYFLGQILVHKNKLELEIKQNNLLEKQVRDSEENLELLCYLKDIFTKVLKEEENNDSSQESNSKISQEFLSKQNELQKKINTITTEQETLNNALLNNKNKLEHSKKTLYSLKDNWSWTSLLDKPLPLRENYYSLLPPLYLISTDSLNI